MEWCDHELVMARERAVIGEKRFAVEEKKQEGTEEVVGQDRIGGLDEG